MGEGMPYTVRMTRGPLQPLIRTHDNLKRAELAVYNLCDLHGVKQETVVYDSKYRTLDINANEYYSD